MLAALGTKVEKVAKDKPNPRTVARRQPGSSIVHPPQVAERAASGVCVSSASSCWTSGAASSRST